MNISLILAVSDNDVIAKDGKIPWFVRGEQLIFKEVTMGHPIIMGRKTYETPKTYKSQSRLLPGRLNIIITRQKGYKVPEGGAVVHSLEEALDLPEVKQAEEVFVIGGAEIFDQALPLANKIYLTRVHATIPDGDKFFHFETEGWKMLSSKLYKKNEVPDRPYDFEFQQWIRQ
jgi:dihydrofolate reductase